MLKGEQGADQVASEAEEHCKCLRIPCYGSPKIPEGSEKDPAVGNDTDDSLLDQERQPFVMGIGIYVVVQKSPVDPVHGIAAPLIECIIETVRSHAKYLKQDTFLSVSQECDPPQCQTAIGGF